METLRVELTALARCSLLHAQQHLEGVSIADAETPDGDTTTSSSSDTTTTTTTTFSAGDYDAARASLALCQEYCRKLDEAGLYLEQRQQTAARIAEAEAALARGDKRLEEGWVAQEEGALIEARDLLRAARHEFEAAFASRRRTQPLDTYEQGLKALERSVYERGLEQLRAAVTQLKVNGDPAAARESIATANQIFEPMGGYALAAAAAAATAGQEIQLRYFMVAGQKVRENAVGTMEKARMSAQERRAWNQRHLAPAEQPESLLQLQPVLEAAEPGVVGGVGGADEGGEGGGGGGSDRDGGGGGGASGKGVPGSAGAGSEGEKKGQLGDTVIVVPTFESMADVSPVQVEQLLRAVSLR